MKRSTDIYGEPEIFIRANGIDRVYHPILTEEERAKRMKRIHDSAAALIREDLRVQRERRERLEKMEAHH